jgi:hypothetical protein
MPHRAVRVHASAKTELNTTSVLPSLSRVFFIGPIGGQNPWLVGTHVRGRLAPNVQELLYTEHTEYTAS